MNHRRSGISIGCQVAGLMFMASCLTPPGTVRGSAPAAGRAPTAASAVVENPGTGGAHAVAGVLPAAMSWASTGPIISPTSDAKHELVAVKDPTIVRYKDRWLVYASSVANGGVYGMVYTSFADFAEARTAPFYYMDQTPGFATYVAAPQLFYFTPQKKWYLIFQSGPPMYATADDPTDPTKWTPPARFFAKAPAITSQHGWLDFWVICDADFCHMFFSDDHGRWYKSKTLVSQFPAGFSDPVVVMEDPEAGRLFEACNVYKIDGANKYLALVEAFDGTSNWRRYFRSWTADSLEGPWTVLHADGASPFAGKQNVTFDGAAWTTDISHGEMIRSGYDEKMTIDPAKLRYLYQGFDPAANTSDYNKIPWRLGLLTQK